MADKGGAAKPGGQKKAIRDLGRSRSGERWADDGERKREEGEVGGAMKAATSPSPLQRQGEAALERELRKEKILYYQCLTPKWAMKVYLSI